MTLLKRIAFGFGVTLLLSTILLVLIHQYLKPNGDHARQEQYAVLSAYIEPGLTGDSHDLGSKAGLLVIRQKTTISAQWTNSGKISDYKYLIGGVPHIRTSIPTASRSILFEFLIANLRNVKFDRSFKLSSRYELANTKDISQYPSPEFMLRFPQNYGYLTFSRVGFNRDLTEALFYTEHVCGMCGEGKYVFMSKINGKWVLVGQAGTWIS